VVNNEMYISRTQLEKALIRAIDGGRNIVIHGESGCGKSWLFKRVFQKNKVPYLTVNMANALRLGDLNKALEDRFSKFKNSIASGSQSSVNLTAGVFGITASLSEVENIEKLHKEPFERCIGLISSKKKAAFIVFENIEGVLNSKVILDQITSIITLLDDEDYAEYNVRIVLIGVPDDLQRYFLKSNYSQTISNRLVEIPEVERLAISDAERLIRKGFVDLLKYKVTDLISESKDRYGKSQKSIVIDLVKNIAWHSDYIPQYLHELCLEVAKEAEEAREVTWGTVRSGIYNWVRTSFTADYGVVENRLNSRQTKTGRRNQAIFALGQINSLDFRVSDVEREIRSNFPKSTAGVTLNVTQTLYDLADGQRPLIRRTPKGDAYRFSSPKLKVCVRCMLTKGDDERVAKTPIEQTFQPRH
jgi:ABC-type dipeptide/oligopeptide/nickel transport system ATPase component